MKDIQHFCVHMEILLIFYPLTHPILAKTKKIRFNSFLANTSKQPEKNIPKEEILKKTPIFQNLRKRITLLFKFNVKWSPISGPASITDDQG